MEKASIPHQEGKCDVRGELPPSRAPVILYPASRSPPNVVYPASRKAKGAPGDSPFTSRQIIQGSRCGIHMMGDEE